MPQPLDGSVSYDNKPSNEILLSVFDVAKDSSVELTSDITEYYVEGNTAVQDHIALKPKMITISGYQGELVSQTEQTTSLGLSAIKKGQVLAGVMENIKNANVQTLASKMDILNPLNPILPPQVAQARRAISRAADFTDKYRSLIAQDINTAKNYIGMAKSAYAALKGVKLRGKGIIPRPETLQMDRQKYAFAKWQYLWATKQLCFVETPWGTFKNMAIQSIGFTQDEDTKHISNISITFKQINKVAVKYEQFDSKNFNSATAEAQHSEMVEMGKTQGKKPDESLLYSISTGGIKMSDVFGVGQ